MNNQKWHQKIDWPVALFLILSPVFCLVFVPLYFHIESISWLLILFTLIFAAATNLSITAGYHRLFSHRSYETKSFVKILFLLVGASAFQGSAFKWSVDHRRHHSKVDTELDPYSINKGFWYAHMGWLFEKAPEDQVLKAADLEKDFFVMSQHKYYVLWAIVTGFGFPTLVGWMMGAPWGGFVFAGALRIVLTQQSTFFINSLCHTLGKQTYSKEISARDSWIVALLTHGEGYHNFHHTFQIDYRNGIRWYHWDPTKWTIWFLSVIGLATKLKTISSSEILKARLQVEEMILKQKGISFQKLENLKNKIITAQDELRSLKKEYDIIKKQMADTRDEKISEIKIEMEIAKLHFNAAVSEWKIILNSKMVKAPLQRSN